MTLTKQMRAAGITLPYGNLAVDEGTAKGMGADAAGIYLSASYVTGIDSPENKAFLAAMTKKFGADLKTPNDLSVPEYEAVYLYKAAVEKAGSTDTDQGSGSAAGRVLHRAREARLPCRSSTMLR